MLEKAIKACFSDIGDLKDKDISSINMKRNDYIELYKNISEKFQTSLATLNPEKKISDEKDILELLIKKIDELKQNITSDSESTNFNEKIEIVDKTIQDKTFKMNKDLYDKIYNDAENKIKALFDISYTDKITVYQNTNKNIVKLYNKLKEDMENSDKKSQFENDINIIDTQIMVNKELFTELDSIYYKVLDIINEANKKIKKIKEIKEIKGLGSLKLFSIPTKRVYEGLRDRVPQNKSYILTSEIPQYIALLKSNITIEETKEEDARKKRAQEWEAQDFKMAWQQSGGLGTGSTRASGGENNTKELRKKLNTMSIKQLKILSDKNHIKYGNKNTIKSLINNYMKHI